MKHSIPRITNRGMALLALLSALGGAATGCTSANSDGSQRRHFIGYGVITIPKDSAQGPDFGVQEVTNYGLTFGRGILGVGYNQTKDVALPSHGAIYVEVQSEAQLQQIKHLLSLHSNLTSCIVHQTTPAALSSSKATTAAKP